MIQIEQTEYGWRVVIQVKALSKSDPPINKVQQDVPECAGINVRHWLDRRVA